MLTTTPSANGITHCLRGRSCSPGQVLLEVCCGRALAADASQSAHFLSLVSHVCLMFVKHLISFQIKPVALRQLDLVPVAFCALYFSP